MITFIFSASAVVELSKVFVVALAGNSKQVESINTAKKAAKRLRIVIPP